MKRESICNKKQTQLTNHLSIGNKKNSVMILNILVGTWAPRNVAAGHMP
jgi:hypothetical protein